MGAEPLGTVPTSCIDRQTNKQTRKSTHRLPANRRTGPVLKPFCGGVQERISTIPMYTHTYTQTIHITHITHASHRHHTHVAHILYMCITHTTLTLTGQVNTHRTGTHKSLTRPAWDSAWDSIGNWLDSRCALGKIEWCLIYPAPGTLLAPVSEANPVVEGTRELYQIFL